MPLSLMKSTPSWACPERTDEFGAAPDDFGFVAFLFWMISYYPWEDHVELLLQHLGINDQAQLWPHNKQECNTADDTTFPEHTESSIFPWTSMNYFATFILFYKLSFQHQPVPFPLGSQGESCESFKRQHCKTKADPRLSQWVNGRWCHWLCRGRGETHGDNSGERTMWQSVIVLHRVFTASQTFLEYELLISIHDDVT